MKKGKLIKMFNNILTVLLLIVLILTIVVLASNLTGKNTNLFGYQFKLVLSGSMEPSIQTGSIIAIKLKSDETNFKKDDVITFLTENNSIVTHRIVKTDGKEYITKGDANNINDLKSVSTENIIGKYNGFTIPLVGYIFHFISSKQGVFTLFIIPGVILIINSFIIYWKVIKHTIYNADFK